MTGQATVSLQLDPRRLRTLIQREERTLDNATQRSAELYRRGRQALSGGVASSFQVRRPWPIYLASGRGRPSGTWTATAGSTSTTASGPWCTVMPTR